MYKRQAFYLHHSAISRSAAPAYNRQIHTATWRDSNCMGSCFTHKLQFSSQIYLIIPKALNYQRLRIVPSRSGPQLTPGNTVSFFFRKYPLLRSGCSNRFFFRIRVPVNPVCFCRIPIRAFRCAVPPHRLCLQQVRPYPSCLPLSSSQRRQNRCLRQGKLTAETGSRPSAYHSNRISSRFQFRINRMPQLLIYFIRKRRPE